MEVGGILLLKDFLCLCFSSQYLYFFEYFFLVKENLYSPGYLLFKLNPYFLGYFFFRYLDLSLAKESSPNETTSKFSGRALRSTSYTPLPGETGRPIQLLVQKLNDSLGLCLLLLSPFIHPEKERGVARKSSYLYGTLTHSRIFVIAAFTTTYKEAAFSTGFIHRLVKNISSECH